ncbi:MULTISPECIES: hypothetical protein [Hymenobacter]|uniref:Uncharacterized protein n=2 Tax=Hymenobacter TaxID=89966 RepID=A0ABS6X421_9BACT|nr:MULTISPECIES: hypothetical protein [Hymenobacter]MBO3271650.1 hypothetical protein [Hymenobacter defluvii]MBW3130567.1 hypothetical protein [Hymenobacter profundi]QNE38494.1 hypothetical protein F1C16_02460 [Hymenobacter sp. NBH84]
MPTSTSSLSGLTTLLRAAGFALTLLLLSSTASHAQTWLVSTDSYVKLGVVDKFGQLGAYTAKFVVTNQSTGKSYMLEKQIPAGQKGVDVIFPSEPSEADYFKSDRNEAGTAAPGRYVWECQVSGKKVVGGFFEFEKAGNDVTVVEKRK